MRMNNSTGPPGVPPREEWDFDFYEKEEEVQLNEDFSNVIVVDHVPVVSSKKYESLTNNIADKFRIERRSVFHPFDEDKGTSLGYAFIQYETREEAQSAKNALSGQKYTKKYPPMQITDYADFMKFEDYPDEYKEPSVEDMEQKSNLNQWLDDDRCRDQFVIRKDADTEIYWNHPIMKNAQGREIDCPRKEEESKHGVKYPFTEGYTVWSPNGSYLATFHKKGIRIHGGPDYQPLRRFAHDNVLHISFSPCEKFLVTFNAHEYDADSEIQCIMVWDIRTGKIARGFQGEWLLKNKVGQWPLIKWSYDDKYFSRMDQDCIFIYDTENGMQLLDRRRLRLPDIDEYEWSPTDHIIAYTVPENDNKPARVELRQIPSREIVGEKHFTMVSSLTMGWQARGDYLAVKVAKCTKTKKPKGTSFLIFRVHDTNIPVETIDLKGEIIEQKIRIPVRMMRGQTPPPPVAPPVKVVAFSFEPIGGRFAIITQQEGSDKNKVTFYKVGKKNIKEQCVLKFRPANRLFWSPTGGWVVIAGIGGSWNGTLEFFNANGKDIKGARTGITANETVHEMCTDADWDPSGRCIATYVTQPVRADGNYRAIMDNGYKIWSNYGQLLAELRYNSLYQFAWRPRPKSLLPLSKKKECQKNLKNVVARFEKMDEDDHIRDGGEEEIKRQAMLREFEEFRRRCRSEYNNQRNRRHELRGCVSDDEEEYEEVLSDVEEQFEINVEVVENNEE